ncbi:GNAT family N-acetyltransferase [Halobellus salinisoli]|uniref:GNAT family N-acetyltransferase n=1 Tax=Halobellus salinisoli TaxID=3108500 RepID=UPI00300B6FF5
MIRPAHSADLDALTELQSYLAAPAPELLASVPALGTCLVSVAGGGRTDRPVGYVLVIGDAHIAEVAIHPAYRREGRARALLRAVIADREPGARLTLTVAVDNDAARSLYESVGFEEIGRQSGFYEIEGGERAVDAVVYAYDVPE